jgi:hypothetical protein
MCLLSFFSLYNSSSFVKSSDCRTIGRSPGPVRSGKWWVVAGHMQWWVDGLLDQEAVVGLTGPYPFWSLLPDHTVGALGPWVNGGCKGTGDLEPSPVSQWVDLIPVHSPAGKLSSNSCPTQWGGWGASWVFTEFLPGQGAPVQCPYKSSLWPDFPLSPSGSRKPGLNSMPCPLSAVFLHAAYQSLNFYESHTLPDTLETWIHMCTWLASEWRGHIFSFMI